MLQLGVQVRGVITIDHIIRWKNKGIKGVEILLPGTTAQEMIDFKKKYLDRYELEPIVTVLIYPDKKVVLECTEEKTVDWFSQGKELVKSLGAKIVRTVAVHGNQPFLSIMRTVVNTLSSMVPTLEEGSMKVVLENHGENPEEIFAVVNRVASNRVGILFDPANVCPTKQNPVEVAKLFGPHIMEVHVKNVKVTGENQYVGCSLKDGLVDWSEIIPLLEKASMGRDIMLVTELGDVISTLEGLEYLQQLVMRTRAQKN